MRQGTVSVGAALFAGALLLSAPSYARDVTASVTVPGSSLVFDGPGLMPPDATGHFAVGIRLPQPTIKARNCEAPYVIVGVGTLNKPAAELTSAEQRVVAGNAKLFADLKAAAADEASVTLPVRNAPRYLTKRGGTITANYCSLSIDQERVR